MMRIMKTTGIMTIWMIIKRKCIPQRIIKNPLKSRVMLKISTNKCKMEISKKMNKTKILRTQWKIRINRITKQTISIKTHNQIIKINFQKRKIKTEMKTLKINTKKGRTSITTMMKTLRKMRNLKNQTTKIEINSKLKTRIRNFQFFLGIKTLKQRSLLLFQIIQNINRTRIPNIQFFTRQLQ